MKQLFTLILVLLSFLNIQNVKAQTDINTATHWYNRANYNPASIARTEYIYLFSNVSQQWIGINGAPKVFNVKASQYIHNLRSAFGVSLVGEKIGVTLAYNPMLTYAYRISNDQHRSFSMGISTGIFTRFIDGSLYEAETANDPSITYNMERMTRPDANIGIEFQSSHFICSISSTHLLSINKSDKIFSNTNHRYGAVIYKNLNPEIFNYHFGMQVINRTNLTLIEGNMSIRFKIPTGLQSGPREIFDLGITYNSSSQMTMLLGMNIQPNIKVGCAYNQSFINGLQINESIELMLEYRIFSKIAATHLRGDDIGDWYH